MQKPSAILERLTLIALPLLLITTVQAAPLQVGQPAPRFELKTQDGSDFSLASREGLGWTVLYFYPKAGTPGCTTQACAFRDAVDLIRRQHAEVYGISTDSIEDLQDFHRRHKLTFSLLSDPDARASEAYGVKMPILNLAKRWTFIVDPNLVVRRIDDDVDPALDAQRVAEMLKNLREAP